MTDKLALNFDRYYQYAELTEFLETACREYPDLARLESIGRSFEGRDIWLLTITQQEQRCPEDKPAIFVDGNTHAPEVTGTMVCLYLIEQLLKKYQQDDTVTYLLDTRTFYIVPRVNPDGAERFLTSPDIIYRTSRPNPDFYREPNHLYPCDVNGDGELLTMRVKDPNGTHRVSELDERLMIPREPGEIGATYYMLYPEGSIHAYDGGEIRLGKSPWSADVNRNFPAHWSPEQDGSGPYPVSEPETRALVEFITSHPNIATLQSYHTRGGIILRPSAYSPDDALDPDDIRLFETIGRLGSDLTGYPVMSIYHGFTQDPKQARRGVSLDWAYEHEGLLAYSIELWDKYAQAGIAAKEQQQNEPIPEEDQVALLRWTDEEELNAFVDWHEFDHPQLGRVELGGFKQKTFDINVPFTFLSSECEKNVRFLVRQALVTPCLELFGPQVRQVEAHTYRITLDIQNTGYLPTHVTQQALKNGRVKPVEVTLDGVGFEYVEGAKVQVLGHLGGYGQGGRRGFSGPTGHRRRVSWVVKGAPKDMRLDFNVASHRAGLLRHQVALESLLSEDGALT